MWIFYDFGDGLRFWLRLLLAHLGIHDIADAHFEGLLVVRLVVVCQILTRQADVFGFVDHICTGDPNGLLRYTKFISRVSSACDPRRRLHFFLHHSGALRLGTHSLPLLRVRVADGKRLVEVDFVVGLSFGNRLLVFMLAEPTNRVTVPRLGNRGLRPLLHVKRIVD